MPASVVQMQGELCVGHRLELCVELLTIRTRGILSSESNGRAAVDKPTVFIGQYFQLKAKLASCVSNLVEPRVLATAANHKMLACFGGMHNIRQ
jgi:hypothetical protein